MNRTSLISMIAAMSLAAAVLDYSTSAQLAIPVLFAFPLTLCAGRRSKKLLWATAGIAVLECVAAGSWAFYRAGAAMPWAGAANHWAGAVNRGLVLDSLLGLTVLFHLWIGKSQKDVLEAAKKERHRLGLIERNEQLETQLAKIKNSARGKTKPSTLSFKQYQTLAAELSDLHRTMVVMVMCSGLGVAEVLTLKWDQVDLEAGVIYPNAPPADRREGTFIGPVVRETLARWQSNRSGSGLVFPSSASGRAHDPAQVQKAAIAPVARKLGLGAVPWNIFPRSYTAWVSHDGAAAVQQKLLRPAQMALKIKENANGKIAPRAVTPAGFPVGISAGAS